MGRSIVCYHYPCPDGAFAALAARLHFTSRGLPPPTFVPLTTFNPVTLDTLGLQTRQHRADERVDGKPGAAVADEGSVVYFCDYTGPAGLVQAVASALLPLGGRVVVLDHHQTAFDNLTGSAAEADPLPPNVSLHLDLPRSGATIALDYFFPKEKAELVDAAAAAAAAAAEDTAAEGAGEEGEGTNEKEGCGGSGATATTTTTTTTTTGGGSGSTRSSSSSAAVITDRLRRVYSMVEDADLWRWALPDSDAFYAGLNDLGLEYDGAKNPVIWDQLLALDPDDLIARGRAMLAEHQRLADEAFHRSYKVQLCGEAGRADGLGVCLAAVLDTAAGSSPAVRSRIGNILAERSASAGLQSMALLAYVEEGMKSAVGGSSTKVKVSLRGVGPSVDTTEVSKRYGGGGHRLASGFVIEAAELEAWRVA